MNQKKILIVYYSQSGQLESVLKEIAAPLEEEPGIQVDTIRLRPRNDYPYPWGFFQFLDTFPESVYMEGPELEETGLTGEESYDLIILGNTTWYLSPAPPISSFLKSDAGQKLIKKSHIVSVIACRNMWVRGYIKMREFIEQSGGKIIDNVVLVDQGSSLATFVTTPRWMLTGKKDRMWGVFPPAGVHENEVRRAKRFGYALVDALKKDLEKGGNSLLYGLGAVHVDVRVLPSEFAAHRSFLVWGKILRAVGKPGSFWRKPVLFMYVTFLITLIMTVVPITMFLRVLISPLISGKLKKQKYEFEKPSGSSTERSGQYSDE